MQLLGLAELADGSLFFSFGGSDAPRPATKTAAQPRAQSETEVNGPTHNMIPTTLPKRQPSSFRKHSPIPAYCKKASASLEATPATQPQAEDKKMRKAKTPSKPARPPSSFSKRSPIPRDRESVPASTSKEESHFPEVPSAAVAPTKATPAKAAPAKAVSYSEKDSPFSPELKEILRHGKEAAAQQSKDTARSRTVAKTTSAAPAKKKPSKPPSEETEVAQLVENGAVSEDLGSYKLPELRNLAKARGLKGYSKLKKSELVDLLASSDS